MACARQIAGGTKTPCGCECHSTTSVIALGSEVTLWGGADGKGVPARVTGILIEGDGHSQTIKYRVEYWAGQTLNETFVPATLVFVTTDKAFTKVGFRKAAML